MGSLPISHPTYRNVAQRPESPPWKRVAGSSNLPIPTIYVAMVKWNHATLSKWSTGIDTQ